MSQIGRKTTTGACDESFFPSRTGCNFRRTARAAEPGCESMHAGGHRYSGKTVARSAEPRRTGAKFANADKAGDNTGDSYSGNDAVFARAGLHRSRDRGAAPASERDRQNGVWLLRCRGVSDDSARGVGTSNDGAAVRDGKPHMRDADSAGRTGKRIYGARGIGRGGLANGLELASGARADGVGGMRDFVHGNDDV